MFCHLVEVTLLLVIGECINYDASTPFNQLVKDIAMSMVKDIAGSS